MNRFILYIDMDIDKNILFLAGGDQAEGLVMNALPLSVRYSRRLATTQGTQERLGPTRAGLGGDLHGMRPGGRQGRGLPPRAAEGQPKSRALDAMLLAGRVRACVCTRETETEG